MSSQRALELPQTSDKVVICTLFDHRYLPRGLCMIDSVRGHGGRQDIWVLCLTEACGRVLHQLALPGVRTLTLDALERHIPALMVARANRSLVEYYFTCMAALHRFLFDTIPDLQGTMYIDADMQFFADPGLVFDAIGDAPVAVIPHNFPPALREKAEPYGLYNAGWSAFRRSEEGMRCLDWWLERSIEWCYDYVDGYRYANQGYLVRFADVAPDTRVLTQKGFNCAPWNIGNYLVTQRDGRVLVDGEPLVFFHFHGVKKVYGSFYFDGHRDYGAPMTSLMRNRIYRPYVQELLVQENRIGGLLDTEAGVSGLARGHIKPGAWVRSLRGAVKKNLKRMLDLLAGRPILVLGGRAF
jgi:hypothetical protein